MPLTQSSSDKAFKANLKAELAAKKPRAQALAITYDIQRRHRARGGKVRGYDTGGAVQDVINALKQGANGQAISSGMENAGQPQNAPASSPPPPAAPPATAAPAPAATTTSNPTVPQTSPVPPPAPLSTTPQTPVPGVAGSGPAAGGGVAPQYSPPPPALPVGSNWTPQVIQQQPTPPPISLPGSMGVVPGPAPEPVAPPMAPASPMGAALMNTGGVPQRAAGGANMATSPNLQPSWATKQQARSMMHTGPILSTVPGRTDNHRTKVPSGSYVLPAAHIASMGEGNSVAGLAAAHGIFGGGGPYGSPGIRITHGAGAPRPPRQMKLATGGGNDDEADDHIPVDVMLSGGEYVIAPKVVRQIGKGSLKNGHAILDKYVMATRKKEIDIQRKLPPPAKK